MGFMACSQLTSFSLFVGHRDDDEYKTMDAINCIDLTCLSSEKDHKCLKIYLSSGIIHRESKKKENMM